jgi:hypothetical protein
MVVIEQQDEMEVGSLGQRWPRRVDQSQWRISPWFVSRILLRGSIKAHEVSLRSRMVKMGKGGIDMCTLPEVTSGRGFEGEAGQVEKWR